MDLSQYERAFQRIAYELRPYLDEIVIIGGGVAEAGDVLFTPLRRRVQQMLDRRFFRSKYNAERILASFAATARTRLDTTVLERQYVGQDMTRVLERAPGVTAYSENGAGNNYSYIRLRGIDQTRINFTLDGIPLSEPEDQGLFFSNFPDFARSVRTAEVQRGVGTSSNGTASYAGAVSFESVALAGSRRSAELSLTAGSFGTRLASLEYLTGHGRNGLAGYARVSAHTSDGYRHNSGNESASAFLSGAWIGSRDMVKAFVLGGRSNACETIIFNGLRVRTRSGVASAPCFQTRTTWLSFCLPSRAYGDGMAAVRAPRDLRDLRRPRRTRAVTFARRPHLLRCP